MRGSALPVQQQLCSHGPDSAQGGLGCPKAKRLTGQTELYLLMRSRASALRPLWSTSNWVKRHTQDVSTGG